MHGKVETALNSLTRWCAMARTHKQHSLAEGDTQADLKAAGGSIGELQLLAQAADGVHNLGLPHACPGPLGSVHLPQHHSKGIHIHCMAHAPWDTPTSMLSRLGAYVYTGAEDVNHSAGGACKNGAGSVCSAGCRWQQVALVHAGHLAWRSRQKLPSLVSDTHPTLGSAMVYALCKCLIMLWSSTVTAL